MQVTLQTKPIKISLTDQQIIVGLKDEDDEGKRRILQNSFYYNYVKDIYKMLVQKCKNFSDAEQLAKDITQETFIKALNGMHKFSLPIGSEVKGHRKIIMKWLNVIANNCFKKEYAKRINESSYEDIVKIIGEPTYEPFETENQDLQIDIVNPFRLKLQNAFNLLSEREKHIITEYADEECIDTKKHLSDKSLKYLCAVYETTPENIRQIKKRALDKIKKICFNADIK